MVVKWDTFALLDVWICTDSVRFSKGGGIHGENGLEMMSREMNEENRCNGYVIDGTKMESELKLSNVYTWDTQAGSRTNLQGKRMSCLPPLIR